MKNIVLVLLLGSSLLSFSQQTKEFMLATHIDLIKTDNDGLFKKGQGAVEINYFWHKKFSIGAGYEYYFVKNGAGINILIGGRFYLIPNLFLRLRELSGLKHDEFSAGVGWSKALSWRWKFELIGDYYHRNNDVALRGGLAYAIDPK